MRESETNYYERAKRVNHFSFGKFTLFVYKIFNNRRRKFLKIPLDQA